MVYQDFRALDPSKYLDEVSPGRTATVIVAAVNASLQSRAQADFVCDGVADDVEINAALVTVATGGINIGRVMLSEGTFNCIADITVPDYCALEGQGSSTRLYFGGDAIANAITIGGDCCSVKNLAADLQDGAGVGGARPNIIYSTGFDNLILENLELHGDESVADDVSDLRQCGILIINGYGPKITNCFIRDCDRHGIHLNNTESGILTGNTSRSNGQWGILIYNGSHWCTLEGNQSYQNAAALPLIGGGGINIASSDDCVLSGNMANNNGSHGILIWQSNRATVSGCSCHFNDEYGINMDTACNCVISDNSCCENGQADPFCNGIQVDVDSVNNQITGNICNLNIGRGMNIIGAHNNISGNQCSTNGSTGIYCSGFECQINDNQIYDNNQAMTATPHGIELGGTAHNCQINNNYCDSPGDSQEDGINLGAGNHHLQVVGNYCANGMGDGIEVGNNDYCLIKDNYCYNNDDYGINIGAAADHCTVENNKLIDNTAGCINDAGTDTILPEVVIDAPNPDGNIGDFPAQSMLNLVDTEIRMKLHCPSGFQELVRAQIIVVPGATGNLRRTVDTDWGKICADEVYSTDTGTIAVGQVAVTTDELECLDIAAALDGIAASDWIGILFERLASNVLDTVEATVWLLGLRMQYV